MRTLAAFLFLLAAAGLTAADDKGTPLTVGGLKSVTPADWKEEAPSDKTRQTQFRLPKADGAKEDGELIVYVMPGAGSIEANLKRQTDAFEPAAGKDKVEETVDKDYKVGTVKGTYQDVKGTFLSKFPPFAPNAKVTKKDGWRQLYVVFPVTGGDCYLKLRGDEKTVEKHKKGFDEMLKNFK